MRQLILTLLLLVATPAAAQESVLLFRPARVFDGVNPAAHEGWEVLVRGERIVAAGRSPRPGNPTGYDSVFLRLHAGGLFADGFESGDTSAWSASVP